MTPVRLLALSLLGLMSFGAQAETERAMPGRPLSDSELSQVHAAGLPESALQNLVAGAPLAALDLSQALASGHELSNSLDRQQALAQLKLATATTQGSLSLMQAATLPALFTPFAPVFLPTLAMPFPFFTLPPQKKPDPGH